MPSEKSERTLGRMVVILLIVVLNFLALLPESQGAIFSLASKGTAIAFLLFLPLLEALRVDARSSAKGTSMLLLGLICYALLEWFQVSLPLAFGAPVGAFVLQAAIFIAYPDSKLPLVAVQNESDGEHKKLGRRTAW